KVRTSAARAGWFDGGRTVAALENLAAFVRTLGPADLRLVALHRCQPGHEYVPGPAQLHFFATVGGTSRPNVENDDALAELVVRAVEDLKARSRDELGELRREAERSARV